MRRVPRAITWLSGLTLCALAGCCLVPKSQNACTNCAPSAIAEVPTTYENYTPPQSLPVPASEAPPVPDDQPVPPPPTSQKAPNAQFDFFEPASVDRAPQTR